MKETHTNKIYQHVQDGQQIKWSVQDSIVGPSTPQQAHHVTTNDWK